jgi:polyisoprenoid-binding protein YceI
MMAGRFGIGLLTFVACGFATAAEWATVPDAGSVTMYATKQGASFSGVFKTFTAEIVFDPAKPQSGRIVGVVRTDSVATGDDQNDTYVLGYLNVEAFPEARFESTAIEPTADGYRALGMLTLAGKTHPVALDFTFSVDAEAEPGPAAHFFGRMIVNRFDFDIAHDVDTNWAGRDVTVDVKLDLRR